MKPKKLSLCHCINMRRSSRKITAIYDEFLKPCKINITQYSFLANLKKVQPIKMNDFAQIVNLERTTLVRNIKPLINQDLVEFQNIEKSKAQLLALTQKGLGLQIKAQNYWQKAQNYVEQTIQNHNLELFYKIIEKIDYLEIPKRA